MNVDPSHAAAMQAAISNERDDVMVRDRIRLMHSLISGQKLSSASAIADEEFSVNQFVPAHFVQVEEPVQLGRIGRPIGKETNPDGGVYQHHHATLRLAADFSRRRGTSRA